MEPRARGPHVLSAHSRVTESAHVLPVTLVVPMRDEERTLPDLIRDIGAQTRPPDQVILVDGGSVDTTVEIARRQAARDCRYQVLEADGGATPGRGRNLGIASARHPWIAMTDAGVRVESTWLAELWKAHEASPGAGIVYGNFDFDTRSFFEECSAVAAGSPKRLRTPTGRVRRAAVVSCLVHRDTVEAVGGFPDLRAGEDMIFAQRVDEAPIQVAWAPAATVWWRLRPDFASTFERFRLYSYHNALAGQQAHWHHRMARKWIPVGVGGALAAAHSRRWLLLAGGTVAGRVSLKLYRHHEGRGWRWALQPARAATVTALVVSNDAATALGWWQAHRHRSRASHV